MPIQKYEQALWRCQWTLEKYNEKGVRTATLRHEGNLLVIGGASALWTRLIGADAVGPYNNASAHIGVGDGTTAAAAGDTTLSGATTFLKAMDSGHPDHTDGTSGTANEVVFKSTFGDTEANFVWEEWGIFNASTGGRMLNHKVEPLGTKSSGSTWVFTVTLSLA